MALHSRCKKAATPAEPQVHWAKNMFGATTKHDPTILMISAWLPRWAHSTVKKQAPWGRLDYIRNLKTIKSVIFETTQDCKCNFRSVSVQSQRGVHPGTLPGEERYRFPLHTLEIGPQISYYILDIDSKTIKTCKCKCNQDGNSCRNNLRVHVNLVHPTLGGA